MKYNPLSHVGMLVRFHYENICDLWITKSVYRHNITRYLPYGITIVRIARFGEEKESHMDLFVKIVEEA